MKLTFNHSLQVALLSLVTLSLSGVALKADIDISSSENGAFVIYSSPLAKGVLPETLLNGKPHPKPFLPHAATPLLAINLGNTYKLTDIRNLPPNAKAYLLNKKPTDKETWMSLVQAGSPSAATGAVGQYLVILFDQDPLQFSDPLVDGDPLWQNKGSIFGAGFGLGNSTPLAITPLTSTEVISH
jgi:hypothetical protein